MFNIIRVIINMVIIMNIYEILTSENVVESISQNENYLFEIIPELVNMVGFEHKHPHHNLDVWNHTLKALSLSKNDFDIRLVLLLHDIGKPFSYQDEDVRHFEGHASKSKEMSETILKRLGFSDDYISNILYLIENHDTAITEKDINDNYDLQLKRYEIQRCDSFAHHPDKINKRIEYLDQISILLNKNKKRPKSFYLL